MSRRVKDQAEHYLIPIPKFNKDSPDWIESRIDGRYALSPEAVAKLRSAIRAERRERYEHAFRWLAALTGVIGALTGLAAVLW